MGSGEALLQQEFGQSFNVVRALAQGWDAQLELVEAVEKVAAEAAFLYSLFQIHISGGNDADIDADFATAPEAIVGHAIEHTQKFDLDFGVEFTNLIEE